MGTNQAMRSLWPPSFWEGEVGVLVCPPILLLGVSADEERTPESQDGGAEGGLVGTNCLVMLEAVRQARTWSGLLGKGKASPGV